MLFQSFLNFLLLTYQRILQFGTTWKVQYFFLSPNHSPLLHTRLTSKCTQAFPVSVRISMIVHNRLSCDSSQQTAQWQTQQSRQLYSAQQTIICVSVYFTIYQTSDYTVTVHTSLPSDNVCQTMHCIVSSDSAHQLTQ